MLDRSCLSALLLVGLIVPMTGCSNSMVDSLAVTPATQSIAIGQQAQFTATGTYSHGTHPGTTQNLTDQANWTSSSQSVATVDPNTGLATAVSAGTANITASIAGYEGTLSSSAVLTVTGTTTSGAEPLASIEILPTDLTTDNLYGTGQFLAYGTFSTAPTLQDVSDGFYHAGFPTASCTAADAAANTAAVFANPPTTPPNSQCGWVQTTWISAMPYVFPVNSSGAPGATAGLVTADGSGNADIYVVAANPDGTLVLSPSVTFNCPLQLPTGVGTPSYNPGTCNEDTVATGLLVTLTVINTGLNTTNWLLTAPSATGTPDVLHCGPGWAGNGGTGGSVCEATYPVNTTVTLTAPAQAGVAFGGWSWDCEAQGTVTAVGPNSCTVYLGAIDPNTGYPYSNVTVGAIFN
jgi:hypothetical protein